VQLRFQNPLSHSGAAVSVEQRNAERAILIYWGIAAVIGIPILRDWIMSWNVASTWARPELVLYLVFSLFLSQLLYVLVARHDNRPLNPLATLIFAVGNGICETLAFVAIYRVFAWVGVSLAALIVPDLASAVGFVFGVIGFVIYGGLIHGMFWLRILPPHLDDSPRSRVVRMVRPLGEIALVLGWSLCLWLYQDFWTVVLFHTLVDVGLMILVRPSIFHDLRSRFS
jgi:hypothetical protein